MGDAGSWNAPRRCVFTEFLDTRENYFLEPPKNVTQFVEGVMVAGKETVMVVPYRAK